MASRGAIAGKDLIPNLRGLVRSSADERSAFIRQNLRTLMLLTEHDSVDIQALTGLSAGTVRNFLRGTDSSIGNVLLMALALGVSLGDVERSPIEFKHVLEERGLS